MKVKTLDDMIHIEDYQIYESESLSLQSNIINHKPDPEIVTHQDIINCFCDYLQTLKLSEKTYNKIYKEITECEQYHNDQGTINDIVFDYGDTE